MSVDLELVIDSLKNEFPQDILDIKEYRGETTLFVSKEQIFKICAYLKDELNFTFLADLTAVDYLEVKSPRYEVVYHIHRFGPECEENIRIRVKAELSEDDIKIDSVTPIWSGADWLEREVYDMFGIVFTGHPDLRRILMPEDYGPFPLRKDFDVRNREPSKRSFEKALEEGAD
ncbi:MAG: NADH-quinone oxidoreductase subunit C [Thermodesulfobacteriota bacterium]|jgi:NADH-quinone oxidoreductase subunit C|nr:NADH-quinone oxidoreductase subunit C [Candidatus Dadabacteria bacterium]